MEGGSDCVAGEEEVVEDGGDDVGVGDDMVKKFEFCFWTRT